jgi:hypothetical protein
VKLIGLASEPGRFSNKPVACARGACADAANPAFLYYRHLGTPCPPGRVPAFDYPEAAAPALEAAVAVAPAPYRPRRRRRYPPHRVR